MYKVIEYFTDLQDNGHLYNVGDDFPRKGLKVSAERVKELAGSNNRRRKPLIQLVEEPEKAETPKKKKTSKV